MNFRRRLAIPLLILLTDGSIAVIGYRVLGGPSVTLLQAIYMAVVSLTGVGYGEIVDTSQNPTLRIFNIFVLIVGVATALYVFSLMTAFIVEGELHAIFRRGRMRKKINELKNHFIVCGLGETGRYVAEELHKTGTPYIAIDTSEQVVTRLREQAGGTFSDMLYVIGDSTDESVLQEAGLDRARGLIACAAEDKDNLVITVLVRQQNPKIRIVSRYKEMNFSERMLKAGANSTVSPNRIGGLRLASEVLRPHVVGFLDLMLQEKSRSLRIDEILVRADSPWAGATVGSLQCRTRFNLMLLALKDSQNSQRLEFNPADDSVIARGAVLIVMGDINDLQRARAEAEAATANS
jgi:voltage-gated potassium channel